MDGLRARGLIEPLQEAARRGDPLLGICVGMQALFEASEEMGEHPGLGLLPGRVVRFPELPGLKVPHTGWNQLWSAQSGPALLAGLAPGAYAYFNHSYYCAAGRPGRRRWPRPITACDFPSAVQRGNLLRRAVPPRKKPAVGLQDSGELSSIGRDQIRCDSTRSDRTNA